MNYASSDSGACPETPTLPARSKRIYIQIPAYRDRELLRTLQDITRTAANTTFCSFHVENGNTTIKRVHSTRP